MCQSPNSNSGPIAATTLSASSSVSGVGFSNYWANPPVLGASAPNIVNGSVFNGHGTGLTGTASSLSVGSAVSATNVAGGTAGAIPYQSGVGATGFISPGTATYILTSNGAGVAPTFQSAGSAYNPAAVAITGGTINGVTGTDSGLSVGTATNATNATNLTGSGTVSSSTTGGAALTPNYAATAGAATGLATPINNTGAGSDISLAIGQSAYVDFSASTSVPLHIATATNQEYVIKINPDYQIGSPTTGNVYLLMNNTNYGTSWTFTGLYNATFAGGAGPFVSLSFQQTLWECRAIVSTRTTGKSVDVSTFDATNTANYAVSMKNIMTDTATAWTSLGTITFPITHSGRVLITRLN